MMQVNLRFKRPNEARMTNDRSGRRFAAQTLFQMELEHGSAGLRQ